MKQLVTELHKLAGVALAGLGISSGAGHGAGLVEVIVGAAYAALIHLLDAKAPTA